MSQIQIVFSGKAHPNDSEGKELIRKIVENANSMFGKLKEVGYDQYLAIEYVHQNYMMTVYDDVLSETIKMRDLFNQWKGV